MMFYHLRFAYRMWKFKKSIKRTITTLEKVQSFLEKAQSLGDVIKKERQSRIQEMRIKLNESNSKLNSI